MSLSVAIHECAHAAVAITRWTPVRRAVLNPRPGITGETYIDFPRCTSFQDAAKIWIAGPLAIARLEGCLPGGDWLVDVRNEWDIDHARLTLINAGAIEEGSDIPITAAKGWRGIIRETLWIITASWEQIGAAARLLNDRGEMSGSAFEEMFADTPVYPAEQRSADRRAAIAAGHVAPAMSASIWRAAYGFEQPQNRTFTNRTSTNYRELNRGFQARA